MWRNNGFQEKKGQLDFRRWKNTQHTQYGTADEKKYRNTGFQGGKRVSSASGNAKTRSLTLKGLQTKNICRNNGFQGGKSQLGFRRWTNMQLIPYGTADEKTCRNKQRVSRRKKISLDSGDGNIRSLTNTRVCDCRRKNNSGDGKVRGLILMGVQTKKNAEPTGLKKNVS